MAPNETWLERLGRATDYRELRQAFEELASAARTATDPAALVSGIDEAIERVRRERARDEEEWKRAEADYAAFKQKQGGVVGWLKRHTPFTEARREDKVHRAQVADQEAGILADNLVIARARILRESLLPPAARSTGGDRSDWERRLAAEDSVPRLKAYAEALATLGEEVRRGRAFVGEVQGDVEAFARADFPDDEDRQRKRSDLEAARREVGDLEKGASAKEALRTEAVARLRALITEELQQGDPAFRDLVARLARGEEAVRGAEGLVTGLGELRTALAAMQKASADLDAHEERRRALAADAGPSPEQVEAAERRRAHAASLAAECATRADAARSVLAQAEQGLSAARAAQEARAAAAASGTGAAPTPPSDDLARAQQVREAAQVEQRLAAATHDKARAESDQADREAKEIVRRRDERRRTAEDLERTGAALRDAFAQARERARTILGSVRSAVEAFRATCTSLGRRSALADPDDPLLRPPRGAWGTSDDLPQTTADLDAATSRLASLLEAARAEPAALRKDLEADQRRKDSAWARRSHELLGEDLAARVL